MPTMVFKMRTILSLLTMVWMLDLGLGQGTCGEDSVTVVSPSLPGIEGCYFRGNYTSNDRDVYTNDGGEVENGTTLAFMVQYLVRGSVMPHTPRVVTCARSKTVAIIAPLSAALCEVQFHKIPSCSFQSTWAPLFLRRWQRIIPRTRW